MEVFLLPVGETRYELYYEPAGRTPQQRVGVASRILRRAREIIAAEQVPRGKRRTAPDDAARGPAGWTARVRGELARGIAEWLAEQRLLWHLRHQDQATLVFPDDLDGARARSVMSTALRRDLDRHRLWMVIDGLAVVVSGPLLFLIPGPNLISWYFAAKMVGHLLAFRGGRQGLSHVAWSTRASDALTAVREARRLPRVERRRRFRAIAQELKLKKLVTFLERTAAE